MSEGVEFQGLEEVKKELSDTTAKIQSLPEDVFQGWATGFVDNLKNDTPPTRGTNYKRTGNLQNSWLVERLPDGVSISNNVTNKRGTNYSRFVVGDGDGKGQTNTHRGRWYLMRDKVEEGLTDLANLSEKEFTK